MFGMEGNRPHNQTVETKRRPAFPFDSRREFGHPAHAPPFLSEAVAHPFRSTYDT